MLSVTAEVMYQITGCTFTYLLPIKLHGQCLYEFSTKNSAIITVHPVRGCAVFVGNVLIHSSTGDIGDIVHIHSPVHQPT